MLVFYDSATTHAIEPLGHLHLRREVQCQGHRQSPSVDERKSLWSGQHVRWLLTTKPNGVAAEKFEKVASGIGQFGSAIAGNANLDPQDRSQGGEEDESVDLHYKDECVEMGDNDKQVLESDDVLDHQARLRKGLAPLLWQALEKRFLTRQRCPLYLQTKTSHRRRSYCGSSTVCTIRNVTWSSVGSNTSNSARATSWGLTTLLLNWTNMSMLGWSDGPLINILLQHKVTGVIMHWKL